MARIKISNQEKVLRCMLNGNFVTSMWGRTHLNTSDIRKYISNLKSKGYIIEKTECKNKKTGMRYKKYSILKQNR